MTLGTNGYLHSTVFQWQFLYYSRLYTLILLYSTSSIGFVGTNLLYPHRIHSDIVVLQNFSPAHSGALREVSLVGDLLKVYELPVKGSQRRWIRVTATKLARLSER